MFFPILIAMRNYQINEVLYNKLDAWLGTRRQSTKNFLSPMQFSIDSGIVEEDALNLFALCTQPDINLLAIRCMVECPVCDHRLGTYIIHDEVPETFHCIECETDTKYSNTEISFWFSLLKEPIAQPYHMFRTEEAVFSVKQYRLRTEDLQQSPDPFVRGLLNGWNERSRCN